MPIKTFYLLEKHLYFSNGSTIHEYSHNVKSFPSHNDPLGDADLPDVFLSEARLCCEIMDMGLLHHVVCLFIPAFADTKYLLVDRGTWPGVNKLPKAVTR